MLCAVVSHGQSFEIATVNVSPPPVENLININLGSFQGGTLTFRNVTLNDVLKYAYELVSDDQLSGPAWIRETRFDIAAQAPPETSPAMLHAMTRELLIERFHLKMRREQKVMSHVALVVGVRGAKLLPASMPHSGAPQLPGRIAHNQMPMSLLVSLRSRFDRQTIVDLTGLRGLYAVKLEWAPDGDGLNLFEAVQQQLGLKLEARRGPVEAWVVENGNRTPDAN
jgi:uncharacterized protein (TIGR03435 family)